MMFRKAYHVDYAHGESLDEILNLKYLHIFTYTTLRCLLSANKNTNFKTLNDFIKLIRYNLRHSNVITKSLFSNREYIKVNT